MQKFGFLIFLFIHFIVTVAIFFVGRFIFGAGLTIASDAGGAVLISSLLLLLAGIIRPKLFTRFLGHRATRPRLSSWFIFVAVAAVVFTIAYEGQKNALYGAVFYNGTRPEPIDITFKDTSGQPVTTLAYPGQIILATSDTNLSAIRKFVESLDGKIIGQLPTFNIYLVEVPIGKEASFIEKARTNSLVKHVSPNLVLEAGELLPVDLSEKGRDPHGMVPALISGTTLSQKVIMAQLDDFLQSSHGKDVQKVREQITGAEDSLKIHVGALSCGRLLPALCSSSDQSLNGLAAVIAGAELNRQKVTINLSWGPVPPKTINEKQFSKTGVAGANAWAVPVFEAYYEQIFSLLNSSKWVKNGHVLLNKSAGNGVGLYKNKKLVAVSGVDMSASLERLQRKFPDVADKSIVFCGALTASGGRASYSNFGKGMIYARVPANKQGTSFASPQCWGASYNGWKENSERSAEDILLAMSNSSKINAKGFAVLNPAGLRQALSGENVESVRPSKAQTKPIAPEPISLPEPESTPEPILPEEPPPLTSFTPTPTKTCSCDQQQVACLAQCNAMPPWPAEPVLECINTCSSAAKSCYAGC